ncbi:peptidyl-prolyl cis-trans isomerase [Rhodoblastus acidophilus]|uniref:Parvulin-like PPIase n=1 Tax=Candidatus Rhodoblastus alkanivorans TaxID=2954117 RepID=A0ABS9ZAN0_9HYPH|nr:peptidyl-prolyl cis-trans isomerase [Candidatus Rhodoblastus alkanivorans]MCI4680001.1 peptidyl-prolyl cis-trans isomerase [Candidatus Rhodoblastus alkanivorans]MCI4684257.1 peptidyl-prolyl cis-trans isomerase [Candidatus Rhodoblastus alkanivorans]MDI4641577.1 peptidyl-prolyl cis-trans isomerase [Rhodoblastus acidophilus]
MLDGLRIMSKNIFGRVILSVFAALIVVGFGLWGIRDMFTNFRANQLATIGEQEITVQQYRSSYQTELQRLQQQARRAITSREARQFGLDRQVLAQLLTGAALDQDAQRLSLALSDVEIAKIIRALKIFAGPDGFDQARMDQILRDNGYTETSFIREQRQLALRKQIGAAVTGNLKAPEVLLSAVNTFANETRKADYFILPPPDLSKGPPPSEDSVKSYYDLHKDAYRSPEYRTVNVLIVSPSEVVKTIAVSDDAARKVYEQDAARLYATPEKRAIRLLTFLDQAAANKARARIDAGQSFDAVAADKKAGGVLADIGVTTKASMFDPAIAQAAFALKQPGVTEPIAGKFGYVLARISRIEPGSTKPFDEVKDQIKAELAKAQAERAIQKLHDKIEDLRSAGKNLTEAAKAVGLKTQIDVTDASGAGTGEAGQPGAPIPALASAPELLKAIFASDVGVDNDAVSRKDGGYDWFEINSIAPSRQLPLNEVRAAVVKAMENSEAQKQVAAKANDLARKIEAGDSLEKIATANGVATIHAGPFKRSSAPGLSAAAVQQIFGTPVGGAGAALAGGGGRIVFKVTDAATPPIDLKNPTLAGLAPQLDSSLADDLFSQYISGLQSQLGMRVNQTALAAIVGQE